MPSSAAERPPCFGEPARVQACLGCAVRLDCYDEHMSREPVHLLPKDRPAPQPEPVSAQD